MSCSCPSHSRLARCFARAKRPSTSTSSVVPPRLFSPHARRNRPLLRPSSFLLFLFSVVVCTASTFATVRWYSSGLLCAEQRTVEGGKWEENEKTTRRRREKAFDNLPTTRRRRERTLSLRCAVAPDSTLQQGGRRENRFFVVLVALDFRRSASRHRTRRRCATDTQLLQFTPLSSSRNSRSSLRPFLSHSLPPFASHNPLRLLVDC
jgi:hypothetical protein